MSRRLRRTHTPAFKAKAALAAIKGEQASRRWRSWPSSLTSTRTKSRNGRRSFWS